MVKRTGGYSEATFFFFLSNSIHTVLGYVPELDIRTYSEMQIDLLSRKYMKLNKILC